MSIIAQAKYELEKANFGADDSRVMVEILEKFFDQWDSGGAVWAVAPVLQRLIAGKPLSPLTGSDDEWNEVADGVMQNRRCSTVFKSREDDGSWRCYDIDTPGRPTITFPYDPENVEVSPPVVEIETSS